MAFSMSGEGYALPYNRFDSFEKALLEGKECKECGDDCDCDDCKSDKKKDKKKSSGSKPDYLDFDKDGDKEEDMTDALGEGYKSLPKMKMARQADKAYGKEQQAVRKGDEAETNKQMQRRIAMTNPSGRKAQLAKEELEQATEGYQRNPEKGEKEAKKYAPVRGEKTPMPPRGNKRREDFEKWYAANVKEDVDLSIFSDSEIDSLVEMYSERLGKN